MGGAVRGVVRSVTDIFGGGGSKAMTPTTITNNISTSGLGTLDNKEAVTSPEEKKTSTLNKKKLGTRGLQIPKTEAKPITGTVLGVQL